MSTRDTRAEPRAAYPTKPWAAYAAAAWMVFFGLVHVYWLLGGTGALPEDFSVRDDARFVAVTVAAIPLCGVGAAVAVVLTHPFSRRRRPLLVLAWATTALLVLHALPAMVVLAGLALGLVDDELTERDRLALFVYEPYWLLGGVLFGLATLAARRRWSG